MDKIITVINSTDPTMVACYWLSLITCVAWGYEKGKKYYKVPLLHALLNCFAGGFLRDKIAIETDIWVFTVNAIPDICFVIAVCLIYSFIRNRIKDVRKINYIDIVISIVDVLGLASLVALSEDKAIANGCDTFMIIISGYLTCCWGGVVANYRSPRSILSKSNFYYHIVSLGGCIIYRFIPNGYLVSILIGMGLLLSKINYRNVVLRNENEIICICIMHNVMHKISHIYHKIRRLKKTHITNLFRVKNNRLFLIFHRIRRF